MASQWPNTIYYKSIFFFTILVCCLYLILNSHLPWNLVLYFILCSSDLFVYSCIRTKSLKLLCFIWHSIHSFLFHLQLILVYDVIWECKCQSCSIGRKKIEVEENGDGRYKISHGFRDNFFMKGGKKRKNSLQLWYFCHFITKNMLWYLILLTV